MGLVRHNWLRFGGCSGVNLVVMKIMSWNVRGLGRSDKRSRVKLLIKERRVDVLLLQETKKSNIDEIFVRFIWSWEKMEFMAVDSDGSARELLSIWNPNVFLLSDCCCNRHIFVAFRYF